MARVDIKSGRGRAGARSLPAPCPLPARALPADRCDSPVHTKGDSADRPHSITGVGDDAIASPGTSLVVIKT